LDEELNAVTVSLVSPIETVGLSDNFSESSVPVTAEEVNQVFAKMKNLEEENEELENRIMLLNQQLVYFKSEGKTNNFSNKTDATVEQIRSITVSLFEKLPLQQHDVESNIKILLDIMTMNKEAQDKLMEIRVGKKSPAKPSKLKGFFLKTKIS
jgi:hypothetical protein